MRIEVHNVDHGGCITVTGPLGHRLMLDCGLHSEKGWYPSLEYSGQTIDTLMLTNLDDDHVEDLPDLWRWAPVNALVTNPTISARALREMKPRGMTRGVRAAHDILDHFGSGLVGNWWHDLGGVRWHAFWNVYGRDFVDTNKLSLAVFVSCSGFTMLYGGDMERAGWEKLLTRPDFVARLPEVSVYVASHHGRENGKCGELLRLMSPEVVIFSDGPKMFGTQETVDWYAYRATGIPDYREPWGVAPRRRKVLTTRRDGTVVIEVGSRGLYNLFPTHPQPPRLGDALGATRPTTRNAFANYPGQGPLGLYSGRNALTSCMG